MSEFIVNEVELGRIIEARQAMLGSALDVKRPDAWRQYGYPETVTFPTLLQAYERGGAAAGAVHRLLEKCWEQLPRIKKKGSEKETPWEHGVAAVLDGCAAWDKLADMDRRNLVGRYAAVVYRVRDGKKTFEPLDKASELVDLIPVYENQIRVESWDTDENSETYGQPTMFGIETAPPTERDTQARPRTWLKVHPSRVQILAEGAVGKNFMDGVPLLRAGFNALIDMEKVRGGGGEGFLKNAARNLVFKFAPDAQLETIGDNGERTSAKAAIEEQVQRLNRNIDGAAVTQGGDVSTLQTSMPDPSKPWEIAANEFAASVRIPFTILFGQQTGRLASDEDRADMNARCKARQARVLTPMVAEFVKRMQAAGIIEDGDFMVEWPDIAAPTDLQKLEHADKMASISQKAASTNGTIEVPFDANEIRQAAGYEPRNDLPLGEGGDPGEVE